MAALTVAHPTHRAGESSAGSAGVSRRSDALYAACGTLLHRLWLDRAPQEPLPLPQLVRAWTALTAPPTSPARPPALRLVFDLVLWILAAQAEGGVEGG